MPKSLKEMIAGFVSGGEPQKDDDKTLTAEQIREMAVKGTIAELRESGLLVDKSTAGGNDPANQSGGDGITWANIDMNTEAGRKAFDDFIASDEGQKRYTLDG